MKTKGQQPKIELLARCFPVSWQRGLMHQPYTLRNGVNGTVRGSESRTHRQNRTSPATALAAAWESIRTAEAAQTRNLIMWLPAVNHKEIHNDVPQLADRHVKAGFYGKTNRVQRWKCQQCGKRTTTASGMLTHLSP